MFKKEEKRRYESLKMGGPEHGDLGDEFIQLCSQEQFTIVGGWMSCLFPIFLEKR